jgi:hypothetical protein
MDFELVLRRPIETARITGNLAVPRTDFPVSALTRRRVFSDELGMPSRTISNGRIVLAPHTTVRPTSTDCR